MKDLNEALNHYSQRVEQFFEQHLPAEGEAPVTLHRAIRYAAMGNGKRVLVEARPSEHPKCVRCWHHREDVGKHAGHEELCGRCIENVDGDGEKRRYA